MKFDMKNIHTIYEAAKTEDETMANLDNTLGQSDLLKMYDSICPISGEVFAAMKDAASDPSNLKLTMIKKDNLNETDIYIEAVEFATYCEAADLTPGEAAEKIEDCCNDWVPGLNNSQLHVVFPTDAINKGELGSTRLGMDNNNDWAKKLMVGCHRFGIAINSGIEDQKNTVTI